MVAWWTASEHAGDGVVHAVNSDRCGQVFVEGRRTKHAERRLLTSRPVPSVEALAGGVLRDAESSIVAVVFAGADAACVVAFPDEPDVATAIARRYAPAVVAVAAIRFAHLSRILIDEFVSLHALADPRCDADAVRTGLADWCASFIVLLEPGVAGANTWCLAGSVRTIERAHRLAGELCRVLDVPVAVFASAGVGRHADRGVSAGFGAFWRAS